MSSVISSFAELSEYEGDDEPSNKLLVLDSLFSVVKCLPGFTKQQSSGFYYVQGEIDHESLYNYTKRIGELTLSADSESRLAMHVLVRIARLQDANKPLFPSLHHLRIANTSKFLDFLDIFLPSALTTIELTAITDDDPHYSSVLSFLECAINMAPHISTLILGPGRIQDQILHISSKYVHLRRLELRNVGISITDQLLRDIGSLRHLETFVLQDNGTSTYKRSSKIPATPSFIRQDPEPEMHFPSPLSPVPSRWTRGSYTRVPSVTDKIRLEHPERPFPVTSAISDCATPPGLRRQQDLETEGSAHVSFPSPGISPESVSTSLFSALRTLEVDSGNFSLVDGLVTHVSPFYLQVLSIDYTELLELRSRATVKQFSPNCGPIITTSRRKKSKATSRESTSFQSPQPPSHPSICTSDIVSLLRRSIWAWDNSLVSITLKNDHSTTFSLPSDVFEILLLRPDMRRLEITGIDIDSGDIKLHRLEEVAYSRLEVLHLPVHSTAASVALVELQYIVENCPHMKSLRCRLRSFWDIPVPLPKSHGLEVLSTRNVEVQLQPQLPTKIARYLDSAFPNLKTIEMDCENGNNTEQWGLISDLVKVCQAVRKDERARYGI